MIRLLIIGLALAAVACTKEVRTQSQPVPEADAYGLWLPAVPPGTDPNPRPTRYRVVRLDMPALKARLQIASDSLSDEAPIISIPLPDSGAYLQAQLRHAATMSPALAAKYPDIRAYAGRSTQPAGRRVRVDVNPQGFFAMIEAPGMPGGAAYVTPYTPGDTVHYTCFYRRDLPPGERVPFESYE